MSPGIVAESDLSGNPKSEYVFFAGERVARKDFPGNAVSFYFSDHLKTASVITNAAGTITEEEDYYPWGGELQIVNNDSNHYKFTGKERDSETGLDYFGARYYGNWLGRWVSPDWAAKPEAVPYSDLGDPQSLNLYSYVRNIPTVHIDPDGHDGWLDAFVEYIRRAWDRKSNAENGLPAYEERSDQVVLRAADNMVPAAVEGTSKAIDAGVAAADILAPGPVWTVTHIAIGDYAGAALGTAFGSVWKLGNFVRGAIIERALGANLPRSFPVIDKFLNGVATSIKTLDLSAKTYQTAEALASKINSYVDKLAEFKGADFGDKVIKASQISSRELQLAVPRGTATSAQRAVIDAAGVRAEKMGVKIKVTEIE